MPATTLSTVGNIINRAAAEVGLQPVIDPLASQDPSFVQLRYLLETCGEELSQAYPWELLQRTHQIETLLGDSGNYDLPSDFYYMINQTGWEFNDNVPLYGPLSPQDWTWLLGRDLVSHTIYASFRLSEGKIKIFPQPPPPDLDIRFEYISKNWVTDGNVDPVYKDTITASSDVALFDKTLISRCLKMKFLEAKGFDSTKAQDDFNQNFLFLTGFDKSSEVLDAGGRRGFPYLDMYRNVPDTGYGMT